jgi:hypothetical protein
MKTYFETRAIDTETKGQKINKYYIHSIDDSTHLKQQEALKQIEEQITQAQKGTELTFTHEVMD